VKNFLTTLDNHVLLADGGMGTQIYEHGVFINRCFDELNLSNPDLIASIHRDYVNAGAELIETNTFRSNRWALAGYGLEDKVASINSAGVTLAREAAGERAYVAGSVGPLGVPLAPIGRLSRAEAHDIFAEQIRVLDAAGVDCFIIETFLSLEELEIACRAAQSVSHKPIIASMSFRFDDIRGDFVGVTPEEAARAMTSWGVAVIGTNCVNGPEAAVHIVERMRAVTDAKISAMPNAGLPQVVEGRTIYMASPEYMAEYARRLVLAGANLVGGCCGTTPAEIAEMRKYLRSIVPSTRVPITLEPPPAQPNVTPIAQAQKSRFAAHLTKKFQISVEIEPPRGLDPCKTIEGARFLHEHGIDAVNIADGARAIARMSPMALAARIRDEVPIETVIHYCCRDRNLLGMQMDLIGAHALGERNLLIITGDPPKMGNFPHATAVFDVDAIGLLHFTRMMNHGFDLSGKSIGEAAGFLLGCGCNPGSANLDLEIARFEKKIQAGAEYVFSQPVYDPEMLVAFLDRTAHLPAIPLFVGILPLASLKNAEFLHNEVPGMQIPTDILERMRRAPTKDAQRQEGIRIAQESLVAAKKHPRVQGAYIFPPFGSYEAVLEVVSVL